MVVYNRTRSNVVNSIVNSVHKETWEACLTPRTGGVHSVTDKDFTADIGGKCYDWRSDYHQAVYSMKIGDYGTECRIIKKVIDLSNWRTNYSASNDVKVGSYWYSGEFEGTRVPSVLWTNHSFNDSPSPDVSPITDLQMIGWGTKGVNLAYPTKPALSIAQTIAELKREGLPSLPVSKLLKKGNHSDIGGEFLNYQFGIAPLISDLKSIINYDSDLVDKLEKLRRDTQGRYRRRAQVVSSSSFSRLSNSNLYPSSEGVALSGRTGGDGTLACQVFEKNTTDVWFSGEFQFHMPEIFRRIPALDKARERLFKAGLEPTPDLLWELTPWSWLLDWYSSVGDAFQNLSRMNLDGAVMRYGYVMYRRTTTRTYTHPFWGSMEVTAVSFQRTRANPFGFGLSFGSLSNRQWAILAALGLSRGRSIVLNRP